MRPSPSLGIQERSADVGERTWFLRMVGGPGKERRWNFVLVSPPPPLLSGARFKACNALTKRCVHDEGSTKWTSLSGGVDSCHFEHVGGVGCESGGSEGVKSGLGCGLDSVG